MALQDPILTGRSLVKGFGFLCVFCLPNCGGSDANSGSVNLEVGGSAGTVAAGGTAASTGGAAGQGGGLAGATSASGASGGGNQTGGATSGVTTFGGSSAVGTGGKGTGGVATGGNASGGANMGGTSTSNSKTAGGANTGGIATGGSKAAGGANTGGSKATGGANTGGIATGGSKATGGANTGGTAAGGASTGGTATGGSTSSSLCPTGITQTIIVAKDGSGQYSTVQAAVDSIASGSNAHIRINIKPGTYTEKITIASRTNLCLVGDSASTTILTYNDSNASVGSTSGSASVYISANDFSAAQLTFQNSYGAGSQAVALRTTGQRQQFVDCRLVGYQDTLYVHSGSQYFRNCYVQGNTDFVFGGATAILQNSEVRNVQSGSATSAPNTASSTAYGLVFLGCSFTAASGVSNVALARPWGADGAAAFLNSTLGSHISSAGFTSMSGNDPANARFSEYQSTGSGANASGRSSYQLSAAQAANYTVANVYGGAWTPSYSQ